MGSCRASRAYGFKSGLENQVLSLRFRVCNEATARLRVSVLVWGLGLGFMV